MPAPKSYKEVKIRFSPNEWETIKRKAAASYMKIGTYIRRISVQGAIKVYDLKDANDVRKAFNRIGVNIDQIAKVANSTGSVYQKDIEDLQTEMKQLKKVVENWLSPLESEDFV